MSRSYITKFFIKKTKNNSFLHFLFNSIIYIYIKLLFLTYRLEVEWSDDLKKTLNKDTGVFYFWHQNIIAATFFFYKNNAIGHCIISPSRDGKIIGHIAQKLGFKVLYGSAYKMAIKLVRQALDVLDTNKRLGIVGDGSRGPAFKLQRGVIYLSAKSQVPLIFVDCKAEWVFSFKKSWDKFQIPLPFSKIFVKIHAPVIPSADAYKKF